MALYPKLRSRKHTGKAPKKSFMYVLFLVSFVISLVQIGEHLMTIDRRYNLFSFSVDEKTSHNHSDTSHISQNHTVKEEISELKLTTTAVENNVTTIWALVTPPGLLGGYRNQVIRLFGMVIGATQQHVKQFLLPSILWSTFNQNNQMRAIPMEDLFDIEHWNTFQDSLPRLVSNLPGGGDCWYSDRDAMIQDHRELVNTLLSRDDAPLTERILQKPRFLTPIANTSLAYAMGELVVNPRKFDVSAQVQHCTHPVAYGAGGGRGILWVNYMEYSRRRPRTPSGAAAPSDLEKTFLQALKPSPKWRQLAQQCVQKATQLDSDTSILEEHKPSYIALHPRIELEMMAHPCGTHMNKNMTKILEDVQSFLEHKQSFHNVSGIFVALSRSGASVTEGPPYRRFRHFVDGNIQTLDRVLGNSQSPGQGLAWTPGGRRNLPVFECGEQLVQEYYESQKSDQATTVDYGSLLPSIINFEVAVEAAVFIGFRFSSWSNSVWTTRYYLGKGPTNFEYTRERGIQPLENGGLPPPHENCDRIKDPG